ncbi:hypothetical protein [Candidatus Methylacidiphilum infernorum]|uniref:DUF305 domain-containing protein n=1 Tax=Methylacidiphilum infernorum (isolate V4) TaxID=481448 RepID=B3DX16_METI4|nr:hypothetical protein [Candidatus Methylacidiphilum infernorum]ACD82156.1 Conserved hypothetical protein [Methylacidiphilum infernorum V4]
MKKIAYMLSALAFLGFGTGAIPLYAQGHHHHEEGTSMKFHHMHEMINHAVEMAAQGSNLIMLGEMGMSPGTDELSIEHGRHHIREAQSLINRVLTSKTMKELHSKGLGESSEMSYTHKLADKAKEYINLVAEMHSVK